MDSLPSEGRDSGDLEANDKREPSASPVVRLQDVRASDTNQRVCCPCPGLAHHHLPTASCLPTALSLCCSPRSGSFPGVLSLPCLKLSDAPLPALRIKARASECLPRKPLCWTPCPLSSTLFQPPQGAYQPPPDSNLCTCASPAGRPPPPPGAILLLPSPELFQGCLVAHFPCEADSSVL